MDVVIGWLERPKVPVRRAIVRAQKPRCGFGCRRWCFILSASSLAYRHGRDVDHAGLIQRTYCGDQERRSHAPGRYVKGLATFEPDKPPRVCRRGGLNRSFRSPMAGAFLRM